MEVWLFPSAYIYCVWKCPCHSVKVFCLSFCEAGQEGGAGQCESWPEGRAWRSWLGQAHFPFRGGRWLMWAHLWPPGEAGDIPGYSVSKYRPRPNIDGLMAQDKAVTARAGQTRQGFLQCKVTMAIRLDKQKHQALISNFCCLTCLFSNTVKTLNWLFLDISHDLCLGWDVRLLGCSMELLTSSCATAVVRFCLSRIWHESIILKPFTEAESRFNKKSMVIGNT